MTLLCVEGRSRVLCDPFRVDVGAGMLVFCMLGATTGVATKRFRCVSVGVEGVGGEKGQWGRKRVMRRVGWVEWKRSGGRKRGDEYVWQRKRKENWGRRG